MIQRVDSGKICARAFALYSNGNIPVATNAETQLVKQGNDIREVSGNLAAFEVNGNRRLRFVRDCDVVLGPDEMVFSV